MNKFVFPVAKARIKYLNSKQIQKYIPRCLDQQSTSFLDQDSNVSPLYCFSQCSDEDYTVY